METLHEMYLHFTLSFLLVTVSKCQISCFRWKCDELVDVCQKKCGESGIYALKSGNTQYAFKVPYLF